MVKRIVNWSDKVSPEDFERISKRGLTEAGIIVSGQAIALCPVVTGRLKGSITYSVESEQSEIRAPAQAIDKIKRPPNKYVCHIGSNVDYAQHVEYGTRYSITGQPYLRPALDMNKTLVRRLFSEAIKNHFSLLGRLRGIGRG